MRKMLLFKIITSEVSKMKKLKNIHPGEILKEDFLVPLELSQTKLANCLKVPSRRINEIILGKRAITANTALRLAKYFDISPKFWLGLQQDFELEEEMYRLGKNLNKIEKISNRTVQTSTSR